jgi:hypothetical protein
MKVNENEAKRMIAGTYIYKRMELALATDKLWLAIIEGSFLKYFIKTNLLRRRITKTKLYLKKPSLWLFGKTKI